MNIKGANETGFAQLAEASREQEVVNQDIGGGSRSLGPLIGTRDQFEIAAQPTALELSMRTIAQNTERGADAANQAERGGDIANQAERKILSLLQDRLFIIR